jgi:hypothetical protein
MDCGLPPCQAAEADKGKVADNVTSNPVHMLVSRIGRASIPSRTELVQFCCANIVNGDIGSKTQHKSYPYILML